jgi:AcrR family transcriptional regulator
MVPGMVPTAVTDKGDQTRRHILGVAAQAFADRGYVGTSLNDLIKATGLTKGGFYFHFTSKEQLALEVLRVKQQDWIGTVLTTAMLHPRAVDQLTEMAIGLAEMHESDPAAGCISALSMELSQDPGLEPEIRQHLRAWVELTASVLRRAQVQGDLRADVDPDSVADMAVCAFIGMEHISNCHPAGPSLRDRVEQFLAVLMAGLRTP